MTDFVDNILVKGAVGRLVPGLTVEQIESLLGPPDAKGATKKKKGSIPIYRYGHLELYFRDDGSRICQSIYIEIPESDLHLPEANRVEDINELLKMSKEDVYCVLESAKAQSFEKASTNSRAVEVHVSAGPTLGFNEDALMSWIFIDLVEGGTVLPS